MPSVSGGGTPRARFTHELGVITELRAGTYVYGDRTCIAQECMTLDDCAAHVFATVVSRPTAERAILDTGSKALSSDPVSVEGVGGFGYLLEHPEAVVYALNEEQALAIRKRDVLGLLAAGGNVYYLAKFAGILGLDVQDLGALQTGLSKDEFKARLLRQNQQPASLAAAQE